MQISQETIEKLLVDQSYVSAEDLAAAKDAAARQNMTLHEELISEGLLSPDLFGQAIAEYYNVPYADLNSHEPDKEQITLISEAVAKKYRVVVFEQSKKAAVVATDDPSQENLAEVIQQELPNKKISFAFSLEEDIDDVLLQYRKGLDTRFTTIIEEGDHIAPEIIQEIINDGVTLQASDIHFEPRVNDVMVRFRIDGVMQEAGKIPKQFYDNILNRIKVMGQMRIDEHFSAQDGAIRYFFATASEINVICSLSGS